MKPSSLINKLGKESSADTNKALESIRKIGGNKSCFDCSEKGVTYVVPKFGVFVCSRCSGIHRELGFMVKGLGVCNFSEKEIAFLQEMGNDNAQKIWLAKFNTSKHSLPKSTDENAVKDHLKSKYIDKKWYSAKGVEEKKEDKVKVEVNDDSDLEEDLKPSQLQNKTKKPIIVAKDVQVKNKEKEKEKEKENKDSKYQEKQAPVKLSKLNMNNNQTTNVPITNNTTSNSNSISNNQVWKPKFEENQRNSNKVEESPFEFFGGKNNNVNVNSPFEFPNHPQDNNPFGWGSTSTTDNSVKTSTPVTNNQIPINTNKLPDDVFNFNFTSTSNTNTNNNTNIGLNTKNTISPNTIDNSKQNNQFEFNFTNNNSSNNNNNSTNFPQQNKTEEKPKKNLDDIMNLLNNNNTFNQPIGQQIPINPSNINFNINNNLYNNSNYPTFPIGMNLNQIAQNPQMMMLLANFMQQQQSQGQIGQMGFNPNQSPLQNQMNFGFDSGLNSNFGGIGNNTPDLSGLSGFSNLNIKDSRVDVKPEVKEVSISY
jgi:hypothetical protein